MKRTATNRSDIERSPLLLDESGTSVFELVMSFPIPIFIILFLLGLGHTLFTKQHALVAARYTSQYKLVHKSNPSSGAVSNAASMGREQWRIATNDEGSDSDAIGQINGGGQGGIMDSVASLFTSFLNALSGNNRQVVRVSTKPNRGMLPRLFNLNDATASYVVEHETWTCEGNRGSYLSIVSSEINSHAGSLPLLGYITGFINRVLSSIPCCETYQGSDNGQ